MDNTNPPKVVRITEPRPKVRSITELSHMQLALILVKSGECQNLTLAIPMARRILEGAKVLDWTMMRETWV